MKRICHIIGIVQLFCLIGCCPAIPLETHVEMSKEKSSSKGIVVTAHPLASRVGVSILEKGGNAIDAGIAVMLALAVVYPEAGNLGGGGFMVYRQKDGQTYSLDFREKAPSWASSSIYLDANFKVVDSLAQRGIYSIGVPGTVDGLFKMFDSLSHLKNFQALIKPAIQLAEKGFRLTKSQADNLNTYRRYFVDHNVLPVDFVKNAEWKENDLWIQKDLANTLQRIAKNGRDEFYSGETAKAIVQTTAIQSKNWISVNDLNNYSSVWRTPIQFNYKSYQIISMGPPSSGGVHLAQLFGMMEMIQSPLPGFHSAPHIQLFTELERRVYADRAMFLGDPDFYKVPLAQLLSKDYLQKRISDIDVNKASDSKNYLNHNPFISESEETTHISILDKDGNALSITTTLNGSFGSFVVASKAGFLLNNEMDDFSIMPGVPNAYGLIGSRANSIAPNKRMLSSMTPTIVVKNHRPEYILGTPGGATIITSVFQVLMNLIEFKLSAYDAVQLPRFHHQLVPNVIYVEPGKWDDSVWKALREKNYEIQFRDPIGRVELIAKNKNGYTGIADRRGDDSVETER
jgi:gamma-glutamyltranspeptidase / glutathione hydrolase